MHPADIVAVAAASAATVSVVVAAASAPLPTHPTIHSSLPAAMTQDLAAFVPAG